MRAAPALRYVPVLMALAVAGCGGDSSGGDPDEVSLLTETATATTAATTATTTTETTTDAAPATTSTTAAGPRCRTPEGQVLGSLRFHVRSSSKELVEDRWAEVRSKGTNYVAAEVDSGGPQTIVVVSYRNDAKYLAGMKAVNGTAKSLTDLPAAGGIFPKGAEQALACLDD